MHFKKLISLFLAVLMLCGALTGLSVVSVSAAETSASTSTGTVEEDTPEKRLETYHSTVYASPEEKLETMTNMGSKGNYTIYADQKSGEVAVKDKATGQVLFSNPYDIGTSTATANVKNRLMSQIIIQFKEVESNNKKTYTSFEYAAIKDQIKIKNIKNGIRVEYTIGREEARHLVPRQIEASRFEKYIQAPMEEYYGITKVEAEAIISNNDYDNPLYPAAFYFNKAIVNYQLKSKANCSSDRLLADLLKAFPIVDKMDIYVFDPTAATNEIERLEQIIKSACPNYSYEEMDYDHQLTNYTSEEENPPLFKMALEYTVTDNGFSVRLAGNGIRFNESKFELLDVQMLPYMGAGNNNYDGYAFFPDGSGALFTFEDMKEITNETITAKIYGEDYAYHKLEMEYQQVVRYPVYGIVENTRYYRCISVDDNGEDQITVISGAVYDAIKKAEADGTTGSSEIYKKYGKYVTQANTIEEFTQDRGFAAIMEEGDALTSLSYIHEGTQADYDTVSVICNPRPRDDYNLADAISVGDNKTVTVVSERKYVGNYKINYVMLTDEELAAEKVAAGTLGAGDWYEASWLGMATAYRDYLVAKGYLTKLSADQTSGQIPLYIESFGAMDTVEKILSIPVEVTRPLTSAKDVITMYEELSKDEDGNPRITNINFKLTGYANGGMYSTIPYKLKWEKAVSKDTSMQDLFDYTVDSELDVYPDFDFSYVTMVDAFDGFSMRNHAVRTIDDRYAYKREYMATQQRYAGFYQLAVSPAYFNRFYTKLMGEYLGYKNVTGISVGSLGTAINSDFDEDEPYNREDAKSFITAALSFISGNSADQTTKLDVMVDGGNAYTWQYVDHILGASLDSSRYIVASYSVPFLGAVLHGYMNFAGSPLNMEGDVDYAKLKAIENGASIYFTLSYQNTQNLKEDYVLSKYYSVRYDIWKDDVVEIYTELNQQLKDVQDKVIVDHDFLSGMRVPDTDELDRDLTAEFNSILEFQQNQQAYLDKMEAESVADARKRIAELGSSISTHITYALGRYRGDAGAAYKYLTGSGYADDLSTYINAKNAYDLVADLEDSDPKKVSAASTLEKAKNGLNRSIRDVAGAVVDIQKTYAEIELLMEAAEEGFALINGTDKENIKAEALAMLNAAKAELEENMGVRLDYSVGNIEVETFMRLHYAYLSHLGRGTTNSWGNKAVVGSIENLYTLFAEEGYGLYGEEAEYLMYLESNRGKTAEEIKAEYGLVDGQSSTAALARYIRELLGENYEFDPILEAIDGAVDANLKSYFQNKFMYSMKEANKKLASDVDVFLQYFNINPQRPSKEDPDKLVTNAGTIRKVMNAVIKDMDVFTKKNGGLIVSVTDGNYDLDTLFSADEMDALVAKIQATFQKYIDNKASDSDVPIEYYNAEQTLESDIRNYIREFYYQKVLETVVSDDAKNAELPVMVTKYKTGSSITMLVANRLEAYLATGTSFTNVATSYMSDAELDRILSVANAHLAPYGDVLANLKDMYSIAFAKAAIAGTSAPKLEASKDQSKLQSVAAAILNERLTAASTADELAAIIADVVACHTGYELKDGYNAAERSAELVYYNYLLKLSEKTNTSDYYYNEYLASVDAAVRAKVATNKAVILEKLGNEFDTYAFYEAVMGVIADKEDPIYDFVNGLAATVPYAPNLKGRTIADDIMTHYLNLLFNCVDGYSLGKLEDLPLTVKTGANKNMALKNINEDLATRISEYMKLAKQQPGYERGDMPNYSMEVFMTEAEMDALVTSVIQQHLVKLSFITGDNADDPELRQQVENVIKYCFYNGVTKQLDAQAPVDFNVYANYSDSLQDSAAGIKNLVMFYTTSYTDIPEGQLDKYFELPTIGGEEEEEESASRYLSDDGRIVSVTYGSQNDDGTYTKYKTFVLNYNNFSVNVEYEGVTYTIPAYGYVPVMH